MNDVKVELIQKEDPTAPFHEKPKFAEQYAYNSASEPEDNPKRNKLTKKTKNPASSLIPKAPTIEELNAQIQIRDQEIEYLKSKLIISENKRKDIDIDINNDTTPNKKSKTNDLTNQDSDIEPPRSSQNFDLDSRPSTPQYSQPLGDEFYEADRKRSLKEDSSQETQLPPNNNLTSKNEEDLGYESEVPHTKNRPISPSAAQINEFSPPSSPSTPLEFSNMDTPFSFSSDSDSNNLTQAEKKHLANLLQE